MFDAKTPAGARELVDHGHDVLVERSAGAVFADDDYTRVGAALTDSAEEVFERRQMIVKVKEPHPSEYDRLRGDQILFTYLHLAPDAEQTRGLVDSRCVAIAYETVTAAHDALPLLSPMSEVAGRLSVRAGATCLENVHGGAGLLMGGVPGVPGARTVVVGGGVVGSNALCMALGLGARVTVLDKSLERLRELDTLYANRLNTLYPNTDNLERTVAEADLAGAPRRRHPPGSGKKPGLRVCCRWGKRSAANSRSFDHPETPLFLMNSDPASARAVAAQAGVPVAFQVLISFSFADRTAARSRGGERVP